MIDSVELRVGAAVLVVALLFGGGFGTAWHLRGTRAELDMANYKADQGKLTAKADAQVVAVEKVDTVNTQESTKRVDAVEAKRVPEVRYVTQQIIKYRDRPVAAHCPIPVDWVRIYNASGTGKTDGVSEAPATRSAPDGSTAGVPGTARSGN